MNLFAYTRTMKKNEPDKALFCRHCKSKEEARKTILNHGMLSAIDYVKYKEKEYTINQVYKWSD